MQVVESTAKKPFELGSEAVSGTTRSISSGAKLATGGGSRKQIYTLDNIGPYDHDAVGVQGVSLAKMKSLNVPIPATFIVSTGLTEEFFLTKDSRTLMNKIKSSVIELERLSGKRFESGRTITNLIPQIPGLNKEESRADKPLLLSLRAVASFPMPDVLENLVSVGMNTELLNVFAHDREYAHWAYESYSQFLQTWGTVVEGIDHNSFADIVRDVRSRAGILQGHPMDVDTLKTLVEEFKSLVHPPEDPYDQLRIALESMINFWYSSKAEKYMDIYGVDQQLRVAVIVQTMVYGNMDSKSGSGVAFSRSPITGDSEHIAEFMPRSSRYELLFQEREPLHMNDLIKFRPEVFYKLQHTLKLHEVNFKDAHVLEFVVERGVFYLIHATNANRSSYAGIRIAVDMVKNKLITEQDAITRFDPFQLQQLIEPIIDPKLEISEGISYRKVGKGLPAAYGAICGTLVFTSQEAIECRQNGLPCILCLPQSSPNDVGGLEAANGAISLLGGIGSFAAVWMRSLGKPAITSVRDFCYDVANKRMIGISTLETLRTGDIVTIDGNRGDIYLGRVPTIIPKLNEDCRTLLKWAKNYKGLKIYSAVKDANDAQLAIDNGADGIEMYDTDSLLCKPERIDWLRTILMSDTEADKSAALMELQQRLKNDFFAMLTVVRDCDVIIRLADYSLHHILPSRGDNNFNEEILNISERLGMSITECMDKLTELYEPNPLLGVRGCRLYFIQPHLLSIQVRAIAGAAVALNNEGITVRPRIQLPAAFSDQELARLLAIAREAVTEASIYDFKGSSEAKQRSIMCELGISLSVPRACLRAHRFANLPGIGFVTINTNELTQMVFGVEQLAANRIMPMYIDRSIIARDPFQCLDALGVGQLVELAVQSFRQNKGSIKINIVGSQMSDPISIRYVDKVGINEITVLDKHKIPSAILAAAQARIQPEKSKASTN